MRGNKSPAPPVLTAPRGGELNPKGLKEEKKFGRANIIGARCKGEHFAVECYKHTTDSGFFERWLADCLLAETPKGHTVIMGNARFHRKFELRKAARGKVRLIFLPPYSSDYNPIEKTWANMKCYLRDNVQDFSSVDSAIYNYNSDFQLIKLNNYTSADRSEMVFC
jgi:transposase